MLGEAKIAALIPARGGSKRLPRKNVLPMDGKPLIAWTIEAALASRYLDRIFVSTDDQEIADIANDYGAEVLPLRPQGLASDTATTVDVVKFCLEQIEELGQTVEYFMLLQPTTPLRKTTSIDAAVELLADRGADGVVGVTHVEHPFEWTNQLPSDLSMEGFFDRAYEGIGSQDLPQRFRVNGAIYLIRVDKFCQYETMFLPRNSYALKMSSKESIDIDSETQFRIAEALASD